MGFFTKESKTKFIRDENGKVVRMEKEGDSDKETNFDRYAVQRQKNRESRRQDRAIDRALRQEQRRKERQAFRESYNESRIQRRREEGRRAGSSPSMVSRIIPPQRVVHVHVGKKEFKKMKNRKKQKPYDPEIMFKKMDNIKWRL